MPDDPNPTDDPGTDPGQDGKDPGKQDPGRKSDPARGGAGGKAGGKDDGDDPAELRRQLEEAIADRDKWKSNSRKHEERARTNADDAKAKKSLEEQIADLHRVNEERDATDLAEKADLAGEKLHAALVRGGLSDDDATVLIGTIDPVRLLTDGKPDTGAIKKLADSLVKIGTRPAPDRDQGRKGGDAPPDMNSLIRRAAQGTRVG